MNFLVYQRVHRLISQKNLDLQKLAFNAPSFYFQLSSVFSPAIDFQLNLLHHAAFQWKYLTLLLLSPQNYQTITENYELRY